MFLSVLHCDTDILCAVMKYIFWKIIGEIDSGQNNQMLCVWTN